MNAPLIAIGAALIGVAILSRKGFDNQATGFNPDAYSDTRDQSVNSAGTTTGPAFVAQGARSIEVQYDPGRLGYTTPPLPVAARTPQDGALNSTAPAPTPVDAVTPPTSGLMTHTERFALPANIRAL